MKIVMIKTAAGRRPYPYTNPGAFEWLPIGHKEVSLSVHAARHGAKKWNNDWARSFPGHPQPRYRIVIDDETGMSPQTPNPNWQIV